jgi:hypothetical protein
MRATKRIDPFGDREEHHRHLHHRQRSRGDASLARLGRPVVGFILHGHGRLAASAVHHSLARSGSTRRVRNEIVHEVDIFPTLARYAGRTSVSPRAGEPKAAPRGTPFLECFLVSEPVDCANLDSNHSGLQHLHAGWLRTRLSVFGYSGFGFQFVSIQAYLNGCLSSRLSPSPRT